MDPRVRKVIDLMHKNLSRKLTVRELAEPLRLSDTHLRRLFRQETGTSLMRFLRQLRMQRAKKLLKTTHLSVKEIAARGGISNVSHFVRNFAKAYGRAPTEHRRRVSSVSNRSTAHKAQRNG